MHVAKVKADIVAEDLQTVRVVRRFDAPAERLFDAWLDRETVGAWLFATPEGEMIAVEIDPRVGGAWRLVERREGREWEHRGEYLALDRPRRLRFSFTDPVFALTTFVTVEIAPRDGDRELTLTHERVLPEWAAQTSQGWGMILDGLARILDE